MDTGFRLCPSSFIYVFTFGVYNYVKLQEKEFENLQKEFF